MEDNDDFDIPDFGDFDDGPDHGDDFEIEFEDNGFGGVDGAGELDLAFDSDFDDDPISFDNISFDGNFEAVETEEPIAASALPHHIEDAPNKHSQSSVEQGYEGVKAQVHEQDEKKEEQEIKSPPTPKQQLEHILDSYGYTLAMLVVTIFVLFIDDVVVLCAYKRTESIAQWELALLIFKNVAFLLFLAELIATSWAVDDYFLSFFFFLDFVALLSFFPDVLLIFGVDVWSGAGGLAVARTGRAARASARAARLVRVVRVVKISNFFQRSAARDGDVVDQMATRLGADWDKDSTMSHKLIRITTSKVTAIVLFLFLATSLLMYSQNWQPHALSGLNVLEHAHRLGDASLLSLLDVYQEAYGTRDARLLHLAVGGEALSGSPAHVHERGTIYVDQIYTASNNSQAYFLVQYTAQVQAALSITLVVCVIVVLGVGNFVLTADANRLVKLSVSRITRMAHLMALREVGELDGDRSFNDDPFHVLQEAASRAGQDATRASLAAAARWRTELLYRWKMKEVDAPFRDPFTHPSNLSSMLDEDGEPPGDGELFLAGSGKPADVATWLACPTNFDSEYIRAILLGFRAMMTPRELLEILVFYFCALPQDPYVAETLLECVGTSEFAEWKTRAQEPLRGRVLGIMDEWIYLCKRDFEDDAVMLLMRATIASPELASLSVAERVSRSLSTERKATLPDVEPPVPWVAEEGTPLTMRYVDLQELARQLTLVEHGLYSAIEFYELLGQSWTKDDKDEITPNVCALFAHFNRVGLWVTATILESQQIKRRAGIIKRFISLMKIFLDLRNYNAVMEVYGALSCAAISRLKKTWGCVPKAALAILDEVSSLVSPVRSYKAFREAVGDSTAPTVPYLGIYLQDLTFIDEGNPTWIVKHEAINISKMRLQARVMTLVLGWRERPYNFVRDEELDVVWSLERKKLKFGLQLDEASGKANETQMYKLSLKREPRK